MASIIKHDLIAGSRKTENLSSAAATGIVLSPYNVISKIAQHFQGTNLRFNNLLLVLHKYKMQKKTSYVPGVRVNIHRNRTYVRFKVFNLVTIVKKTA